MFKKCLIEILVPLSKEKEIDKDSKENTSAKQPGHYRSFQKIADASHSRGVNSIFHTPLLKIIRQGNGLGQEDAHGINMKTQD